MAERDEAKGRANKSDNIADWQTFSKLRKHLTKLNIYLFFISPLFNQVG